MGNASADAEGNALQGLLDAFPFAPLDLIASAYVQAHSDQELAAEIICLSLNGISSEPPSNRTSSGAPDVPGSRTCGKSSKALHAASHRRTTGPCPPTLEDYFPSSPEKNAWIEPLSQHLQKNVPLQNQQNASSNEIKQDVCSVEFPSLERKASKGKGERMCLLQPLASNRSTSRASAAFGLASSARTRSHNGIFIKTLTATNKDSTKQLKQLKQQALGAEEMSLWPTEAEASLLSMLGDEFNLDIGAVRDVLGYYKGDIQKSFEALQELNSSSTRNDQAHKEVSELGMTSKNSSLSESFKDIAAVENPERREMSSMTMAENCSAMQSHALKTYHVFERAILKHENSSMKWVVECLCTKYPHADMATLLEVLRATNFDLNDAEKMLQEAGLHEGSPGSQERMNPSELAKRILESLFSKPQEVSADHEERHKENITRHTKDKAAEVPKWKAVTSTELDISGDEEGMRRGEAHDITQVNKVVQSSEVSISEKEGGRSSYGDWDDYERHQASAKQHWKTMQSYLTAATVAYAASDFSKAELLTEKGNMYKQLSMEAKERASTFLLSRQNESDFTLDLQEQHIPEALQLLRLHLKSFSSIPSCCTFTVVTGCFENPKSGHQKIKQEVAGYLQKKGYKWVETSPFCLQIQMRETKQL